jgi:DNA helicase-2/ATP-dependent DNA helicase PcrA
MDPLRQQLLDCDGHALVIGGPGSGKTTIALKKAVTRIKRGLSNDQSVLFLSFSRAAVTRIGEASKTETAKDQRSLLNIQTFHSFCWEILCAHAYLLGAPRRLQILMPQDERVLSGGIKPDKNPIEWAKWLIERDRLFLEEGRIAFDLFAPKAVALLQKSAHVRRLIAQRHPLIVVDEAQDTSPDPWRCIELLAPLVQVICLADLDQQIFDYLPGVGPERIEDIRKALSPFEISLGSQNHRSAGSEIVEFANDILAIKTRGKAYKGVSRLAYSPKTTNLTKTLRTALGILHREIRKEPGERGRRIAILVPSGPAAAKISAALNTAEKPVRHKLLFDESEALLAARFAAFLLEPKITTEHAENLARALELLADTKRANGSSQAQKLLKWAVSARTNKKVRADIVLSLNALIKHLGSSGFTGNPAKDWIMVKKALRDSNNEELIKVARHLDYLVAFNRGKRISANLAEAWQRDGQYTKARELLDLALAQDQILDGADDPAGLQVMTIHKSKGKQFDGVIVVRDSRHDGKGYVSNFVWYDDPSPHLRSRKILRVAVTRARIHTLILEPAWPQCPILSGHTL